MRETVRAFYYPRSACQAVTLKKAILLFDEIHFADRPSFTFHFAGGFGMIGSASPLRAYEQSFRDEDVPLFVHGAPGGPLHGEFLQKVVADIADQGFLQAYQQGLRETDIFCETQIARGNYGSGETHETLARKLAALDIKRINDPIALLEDATIKTFDLTSDDGVRKNFLHHAMECSAVMNFALDVGAKEGITPLADALPFGNLLGAKYRRAIGRLDPTENVRMGELSFAIFDEVVPAHVIESLSFKQVVSYRKSSEREREAFLEHLLHLESKLRGIPISEDYPKAVSRFVTEEVTPAARQYRNNMQKICEKLFGSVVKSMTATVAGTGALQIFADLSWPNLLRIAALGGAAVVKHGVDAVIEWRAVNREAALAYLINI